MYSTNWYMYYTAAVLSRASHTKSAEQFSSAEEFHRLVLDKVLSLADCVAPAIESPFQAGHLRWIEHAWLKPRDADVAGDDGDDEDDEDGDGSGDDGDVDDDDDTDDDAGKGDG